MGGLGLVLDVAKNALLTQQQAIDVTSHNIANVSTEGYTKQSPVLAAKNAAPYGGFVFGRGVELNEINRLANNFIEQRLQEGKSDLSAMSEKEIYMDVLESIFNENSGTSLSNQYMSFWNAWNDLANNPSGLPERNLLYENSVQLSQSFNSLYNDLTNLSHEIDNSIEVGVNSVNELLQQVADINEQILVLEVNGDANDLRDRRESLVKQLADYMDIKTYEYEDGNLTVTTDKGYILVSRTETYPLSFEGGEVNWQSSGGTSVEISDTIKGGKLGGWLDIRDEIIPKFRGDLDELAKSTILEVNKIHSQGAGLERLASTTSTYSVGTGNGSTALGGTGLLFKDEIIDDGTGSVNLWLYDENDAVAGAGSNNIIIDGTTTLDSLATAITAIDPNITASVSEGKLQISTSNNYRFAFSDDTSNVLAALGINTFFTGQGAYSIAVNSSLNEDKNRIAAGKIDADGNLATGDNTNALDIANLQYEGVSVNRWTYSRGSSSTSVEVNNTTIDDYLHALVGEVGVKSQSVKRQQEYCSTIYGQIEETRNNLSGVSLDEEMTLLIQYQQAYTAAAKLISTVDEMLKTLLDSAR